MEITQPHTHSLLVLITG